MLNDKEIIAAEFQDMIDRVSANLDSTGTTASGEKINDYMVHCHFTDRTVCFIGGDSEVNGVVCTSSDEIINELNK